MQPADAELSAVQCNLAQRPYPRSVFYLPRDGRRVEKQARIPLQRQVFVSSEDGCTL